MHIAVLGTGSVGQALGSRLLATGHKVIMGARDKVNDKAIEWVAKAPGQAGHGTFSDAASTAEVLFLCVKGQFALDVLRSIEPAALAGKVLVDVCNALVSLPGGGMGIMPEYSGTTSLGEEIQKAFPEVRVVKSLNTMWGGLMGSPGLVAEGNHSVFMSGDDAEAKNTVARLLEGFGWDIMQIHDLGGIATARGPEQYLHLWLALRMMPAMGTNAFNIQVVR